MSLLTACNQSQSLQSYLVKSQEKKGFMNIDIPSSFLQFKSPDVSEKVKNTLKSIRKINLIGLPYLNNEADYENEKKTIKEILTNSNTYKNLMRMDMKGMKVTLYYSGSSDSIDEVIAFGYSNKVGVGIARVLGEDMNLSEIIKMMKYIKMDPSQLNLNKFNISID